MDIEVTREQIIPYIKKQSNFNAFYIKGRHHNYIVTAHKTSALTLFCRFLPKEIKDDLDFKEAIKNLKLLSDL